MTKHPKVSVCITAYNHSAFIAECIESVLKQKTNFPFEIVIGEDESSDDTRAICKNYQSLYPDQIELHLRKREDVFYYRGRATGRFNYLKTLEAAKGTYIAKLDGDDMYLDPLKLQKQVDVLDQRAEVVLVYSNAECEDSIHGRSFLKHDQPPAAEMSLEDLLQRNPIVSSTVLFRRSAMSFPPVIWKTSVADIVSFMFIAQHGLLAYLPDVTTLYRIHAGGVHSGISYFERVQGRAEYWELLRDCFGEYSAHLIDANIERNHLIAAPRALIYGKNPIAASRHLGCAAAAHVRRLWYRFGRSRKSLSIKQKGIQP